MRTLKKKIVCILLIVSMVFVLFGCGSSNSNDKEKFLGTWVATVDMTEYFNEMFQLGLAEADEDVTAYFSISKFEFALIFTFFDDDTYSASVDIDKLDSSIEAFKSDLRDGLERYFEDAIAELGYDMTVDEMLAYSDLSLDDMIDQNMSGEMVDDIVESFEVSGRWKAENGKLYMSESVDDNVDANDYELYEITSDGIKIVLAEGEEDEMGIFPLLLKKA